MTFIANLNGNRVVSLDFTAEEWHTLKQDYQDNQLICNDEDCQSPMILKTYHSTGTQFFSHKPSVTATHCSYRGGESREHLYMKQRVYDIIKGLGLNPDLEVRLTDKNRRADVLVGDNVFEIQLSKQSLYEYEQRSQDYWDMGKEVYWIASDDHHKFDQAGIVYPVALLNNGPCAFGESCKLAIPYANLSSFASNTADLDEWITNILSNGVWAKENRIYQNTNCLREELRRKFFQYWGFIVEATEKYPLGLPLAKAFNSQIQKRYNTDYKSLSAENLRAILNEVDRPDIESILVWLYPNQVQCLEGKFGKFKKLTSKAKGTRDYAVQIYSERKRKQKQMPDCACPSKYYEIGAFKRRDGVFIAHRFCDRCGSRSWESIARRKFQSSVIRNAYEWVKSKVNYIKTDNQPWT